MSKKDSGTKCLGNISNYNNVCDFALTPLYKNCTKTQMGKCYFERGSSNLYVLATRKNFFSNLKLSLFTAAIANQYQNSTMFTMFTINSHALEVFRPLLNWAPCCVISMRLEMKIVM